MSCFCGGLTVNTPFLINFPSCFCVLISHFEIFAELGGINFEDFVLFGEKKFEGGNKILSLHGQISTLWNQRDSLNEKYMTVCSNGSKKATGIVLSS